MQIFGNGNEICFSVNSVELRPITIYNTGKKTLTNIEVTVDIPDGIEYLSHIASTGTFDSGTNIWTVPSLIKDASATLEMCFTIVDVTESPWKVTYNSTHDDSIDANPNDDDGEINFVGFSCLELENCQGLDIDFCLAEYISMDEAQTALGIGAPFLAKLDNIMGAEKRAMFVTPCVESLITVECAANQTEPTCGSILDNIPPIVTVCDTILTLDTGSIVESYDVTGIITIEATYEPLSCEECNLPEACCNESGEYIVTLSAIATPLYAYNEGNGQYYHSVLFVLTDPCDNTATCTTVWISNAAC